jgi:EmrB/QacA subfamily drug resistance transporter
VQPDRRRDAALPPHPSGAARYGAHRWIQAEPIDRTALRVAVALLVGSFPTILGTTTVSVALHELTVDLGVGVEVVSWVTTAYLLSLCVVIPLVGWLQGLLGARRLWIAALSTFLVGSLLCGAAWDAPSLIVARVVQGLGGGAMMPLLTTILIQVTPARDRPRVTSLVALSMALGPILGPVVGGVALAAADWRWLFWMNVPLSLVGLWLAWRLVPVDEPGRRTRLDVVGLCLLPPALFGMVWGLSRVTGDVPRPSVWTPVAAGAVLLAAFVWWARRRGGDALVDLRVLRSRPTWAATAVLFLSGAALHGAMFLLPLYWQQVRGADALAAGLLLVPQGVGSLLSRVVALRLMEARGPQVVAVVGFALTALATVPFALAEAGAGLLLLESALFVRGLGIGMVVVPLFSVAFDGLEHDEVPHASIVVRIGQQIGGAVGVALLAVVLASVTATSGSPGAGFDVTFWWACGIAALAMLGSFALPRRTRP